MNITIEVDTKQLSPMATFMAGLHNTLESNLAKAMTYAAHDARKHLEKVTPSFIDRPTSWTVRSTFVQGATADNTAVRLGFKDWASKGTPAARYLQPIVAGGIRPAKSAERQLRSAGLISSSQFIVPTGVTPLKLNQYGNLSPSAYTQVLSRLRALGEQGYSGNRSGSARSTAKARQRDYFIGRPGGLPLGIYARVGKGQRGFHTVFYITGQPSYSKHFPVQQILQTKFNERFPSIFDRLVFSGR